MRSYASSWTPSIDASIGTPAGVNAVVRGDLMEGHCDGIGGLSAKVV